jgi:hypothetical protein
MLLLIFALVPKLVIWGKKLLLRDGWIIKFCLHMPRVVYFFTGPFFPPELWGLHIKGRSFLVVKTDFCHPWNGLVFVVSAVQLGDFSLKNRLCSRGCQRSRSSIANNESGDRTSFWMATWPSPRTYDYLLINYLKYLYNSSVKNHFAILWIF